MRYRTIYQFMRDVNRMNPHKAYVCVDEGATSEASLVIKGHPEELKLPEGFHYSRSRGIYSEDGLSYAVIIV